MSITSSNESGWGLSGVRRILLVSSGKGGVGKSQMAVTVAIEMWRRGWKVGVLDLDLAGPSIPQMMGLGGQTVRKCSEGYVPVIADKATDAEMDSLEKYRMKVMSLGFLLPPGGRDGVAWKDPKKTSFVQATLNDTRWGILDCLIVDLPPGVTGEKLTVAMAASCPTGVLIVSSPQIVALSDVRKEVTLWQRHQRQAGSKLQVLGLMENMSGKLSCPRCGHQENIFTRDESDDINVKNLALARQIPFFGSLPLLPAMSDWADSNESFLRKIVEFEETLYCESLSKLLDTILIAIERL